MAFSKLKQRRSEGFTLVELLIVIVVIAILAAITIIAYNGVTQKARTSQAQSAANSVQQVAELYNTDKGHYPGKEDDFRATGLTTKLPTSITLEAATSTTDGSVKASDINSITGVDNDSDNSQNIGYGVTTSDDNAPNASESNVSGGVVWYYDYSENTLKEVYVGDGASGSTIYQLTPHSDS